MSCTEQEKDLLEALNKIIKASKKALLVFEGSEMRDLGDALEDGEKVARRVEQELA